MEITVFKEKLNKVEGISYVVEEEVELINGVYEGVLQHDNIHISSLAVYTGSKLTGDKVEEYSLSTPSSTPWKKIIRVYSDCPVLYISYETEGDTVEAEDINRVQDAIVTTQTGLHQESERAKTAETNNKNDILEEKKRALTAEDELADELYSEVNRSKTKEADLESALFSEITRAMVKEEEFKENMDANMAVVNKELSVRYTKDKVYTKEEVLVKIEQLIGAAPETLDTLHEIAEALGNDPNFAATIMNALAGKVDKTAGKGLSSNDYTDDEKAMAADVNSKKHTHNNKSLLDSITALLLNKIETAYDKIHEHMNKGILDKITQSLMDTWNTVSNKVDKIDGMGLSANNYTGAEKVKLAAIEEGAEVNVQSDWNVTDSASDAFIKNKPSGLPASDVPAWAKSSTKPAYTPTEVGVIDKTPASGQVPVFDGTTGKLKSSGYTLNSSVPSDAKFTDTVYTHPITDGNKHVPANGTINNGKYLKATSTAGMYEWGSLTSDDVTNALGYPPGSRENNTTYSLSKSGTTITLTDSNGIKTSVTDLNTTYSNATVSASGLMSAADKEKLDKIADSANNYSHPSSGITAGTYRSLTVNAQGHVTSGTNPTTLAGYGITDAAKNTHNHDAVYIKKAPTWNHLMGV